MTTDSAGSLLTVPLRIAGILRESIVDGPGIRAVLFTQGCPRRCPGCHNPETQNPQGGRQSSVGMVLDTLLGYAATRAVTLSGGDPFMQPEACTLLATALRGRGIHLVCYTGYVWEELYGHPQFHPLLRQLDILIDGPYRAEEHSLELRYRGSRNQRLLDVQRSLESGIPVLSPYHR